MQDPRFFCNLRKGRERNGIVTRVVRKWLVKEATGRRAPLFIGMVLADAKGDAMYGEIPQDWIDDKEYLFQIGHVYTVKKFFVRNAKSIYKAVDRDLMIEITEHTTVEIMDNPPPTIPHLIYKLTPFSAIVGVHGAVPLYIDTIGYLVRYDALHTFYQRGNERPTVLREIYIRDLRNNTMKVTLWEDMAVNFNIDTIYDEKAGNLIVCLIVGCIPRKVHNDNAKSCLSGSSACCYYFNPDIQEAASYHSKFKNTPIFIERPPATEEDAAVQVQDIQIPQKTIAELQHVDPFDDEYDGPYKCAVTITSIPTTTKWWYMSCKTCKKKTEQQPDRTYRCPKCYADTAIPRYLLSFMAADDTGEANFFAHDSEAKKIVQKDCEAIMNPLRLGDGLPQPLQNILNKKFVFSIDLKDDSCKSSGPRQYIIKSVLERPSRRTPPPYASISTAQRPANISQPSHSARTGTSHEATTSAEPHDKIMQIETAQQSTPAPTIEIPDSPSKNQDPRSPGPLSNVRRNLFETTNAASEQLTDEDDLQKDDDILQDSTVDLQAPEDVGSTRMSKKNSNKDDQTRSPAPSQQTRTKRPRTTTIKTSGGHTSTESTSDEGKD